MWFSTDILVLSADQQRISVYIWDHGNFDSNLKSLQDYENHVAYLILHTSYQLAKGQFIKSPSATIAIEPNDFTITNVLPGDFNYDGNLDVLVMGPNTKNTDELILRVYIGDGSSQFST